MAKKLKLDNLSAEELKDLASPLTDEEIKQVNKFFEPYIFYRNLKDGTKECFCTSCNEHYIYDVGRVYTSDDLAFINSKHNEVHKCPKCGRMCTVKSIGKARNAGNLWEEKRFVIVEVLNENAVLFKCYYASKGYSQNVFYTNKYRWMQPVNVDSEEARFLKFANPQLSRVYLLQPGNVQNARLEHYYYWYIDPHWELKNKSNEPFYGMFGSGTEYVILNLHKIHTTFLRYAALKEWKNTFKNQYDNWSMSIISFLCRSAEYPALEILTKLGFEKIVDEAVICNRYHKRYIDWNAKSPWDILKMPKMEYKKLLALNSVHPSYLMLYIEIYHTLQRLKIKGGMERVCGLADMCGGSEWIWKDRVLPLLKQGCNATRFENYLEKNTEDGSTTYHTLVLWSDYIKMAQELKYDLSDEVVRFPKHLKSAHDTAERNIKLIKENEWRKANAEKLKKVRKYKKLYGYIGEKYSIVLPTSPADIVTEGQLMHHCVGGYAERHFNGTLCICFLRKNDAINTPLYTIEMHGKELVQVQRKKNAQPAFREEDAEVKAFFDEWLEWVKNGSKKQKEKTVKTDAA